MPQLFGPQANARFRVGLVAAVVAAVGGVASAVAYRSSDSAFGVGDTVPQPIPFRHDLHAGRLQIDCRYCHSSVERAAFAGMPSALTCMTCHSQVWTGATVLEPVRTSLALDQPIAWNALYRLPTHAYFHHGIHVAKGVACETCHGQVRTMEKTTKAEPLSMPWCLECHRDPAPFLKPPDAAVAGPASGSDAGREMDALRAYAILIDRLTDCSTCHR